MFSYMVKSWFIWGLLISCCCLSTMGRVSQADLERQIEYLYLDQAEANVSQLENPAVEPYYRNKIQFLRQLTLQDPKNLPTYFETTAATIKELDKLPEDMPLKGIMLAEVYFQSGMIRFLNQSYLSAVSDLQESCNLIHQNQQDFRGNKEQLKLLGAFNIALASVPKKFRWATRLLCFKGDMETGIRQLEEAASSDALLMPGEAEVLLFYVDKNLLNRPEAARERIQKRYDQQPDCFTWNFFLVSTYLDLHQTDSALAILKRGDHFRTNAALSYPPFWDYLQGKAHYYRQEYTQAQLYFGRFLTNQKGPTFRSDALFRTGISLVLNDDYPTARTVFERIVESNSSGLDADEYAVEMAKRFAKQEPSSVEKKLFEARNLYDGGYTTRSLFVLKDIQQAEFDLLTEDQAELSYRFARNFELIGDRERAKQYYAHCAATPASRNQWMCVYSLYYSGKLEWEEGHTGRAKLLFEKALTADDYFYQSGLEQRCKAALSQLKNQ